LNIQKKGYVAALEKRVRWGFDAGCEHSERILVDEPAKNPEIGLGVSGADVHS
jgi:hypothetical protein